VQDTAVVGSDEIRTDPIEEQPAVNRVDHAVNLQPNRERHALGVLIEDAFELLQVGYILLHLTLEVVGFRDGCSG
jgi:hypothetical protein